MTNDRMALAELLEKGSDGDLLREMIGQVAQRDFPKDHRVKIHSTNVLERLNGELKRRADVVGIFLNESAIRRLVGALLREQNDEYAIRKRYMSLESLAQLSENPAIRLPAAPALAGASEAPERKDRAHHRPLSTPRPGTQP